MSIDQPSSPSLEGPASVSNGTNGQSTTPPILQTAFRERFDALLPTIQKEWPEVARHTLEATRGSFDQLVEVISRQTGGATPRVKEQLLDLIEATTHQAQHVGDSLKPLEEQLDQLLDDLNRTLRPKLEKPVRERPLMALGVAVGVGLLLGLLLSPGRRSA
ncbi:MAG: glycine zipper domain-containing protein [Cyanobium sp.]